MVLSIPEVICKKRDGFQLTPEEIQFFIESVVRRTIDDSQIGAMLMAMYLNKLTVDETVHLTNAMITTGEIIKFKNYGREILVDKHSTGGVGDKTSLVLAAALAACGFKVPMISGRGLGYTGGTLDKLESIPGFQVSLNQDQMNDCLKNAGCFICGATSFLVPADRILYNIRDITGTVDESSLIVSSILSKKAAAGIGTLVMDVKFGSGATLKSETEARKTAELLKKVGNKLNLNMRVILSDMNSPLGNYVGNTLEVVESVMCLRNEVRNAVTELVKFLGGTVLESKGVVNTIEEGKTMIQDTLTTSSALNCFHKMLVSQGVSEKHAEGLCSGKYWKVLPKASCITQLRSPKKGVIVGIDALNIAKACWHLGAGRSTTESKIDHSVGVVLLKTVNEIVDDDEPWVEIHHSEGKLQEEVQTLIQKSLLIEKNSQNVNASLKAYLV